MWKEGGFQDIYVMNSDGSNLYALTFDKATDEVWHGERMINICSSVQIEQVCRTFLRMLCIRPSIRSTTLTGVLPGCYAGSDAPSENYSGSGMDIHLTGLNRDAPGKQRPTAMNSRIEQQIATAEQHESLLKKIIVRSHYSCRNTGRAACARMKTALAIRCNACWSGCIVAA